MRERDKVSGINHNYNQRAWKLHHIPFGPCDSSWLYRRRMKIYCSTLVSFKVDHTILHISLFFHFFASSLARKVDSFALRYIHPPYHTENWWKNKNGDLRRKIETWGANILLNLERILYLVLMNCYEYTVFCVVMSTIPKLFVICWWKIFCTFYYTFLSFMYIFVLTHWYDISALLALMKWMARFTKHWHHLTFTIFISNSINT